MKSLVRTLLYVLGSGVIAWIVALLLIQICTLIWPTAYVFEYELLTKPTKSDWALVEQRTAMKNLDITNIPRPTIKVPQSDWMSAKKLVLQELELLPQSPLYYGLPGQPRPTPGPSVVVIEFERSGKPKNVDILSSSGSPISDREVRSSLYHWRAHGELLMGLDEDETFVVRMELNRRADKTLSNQALSLREMTHLVEQVFAGSGEWYEWKLEQPHQITAWRVYWLWRAMYPRLTFWDRELSPRSPILKDYSLYEGTTIVDGYTFHGPQVQDIFPAHMVHYWNRGHSSIPASNDAEVKALMSMGERSVDDQRRYNPPRYKPPLTAIIDGGAWLDRDSQIAGILAAFGAVLGFIICWRRLIKRALFGTGKITAGVGKNVRKIGSKASHAIDDKLDELNK